MYKNHTILIKLLLLLVITSNSKVYTQNKLYSLSFKANQGSYKDTYCEYYYHIQKEGNKYLLTNPSGENIFEKSYDTIIKNAHFIKTIQNDSIVIYKSKTLERINIPNLQQAYFIRDGLEVLTNKGAMYYDNTISKIDSFPKLDFLGCGTVYSKRYHIKYNHKTQKPYLFLSFGNFGDNRNENHLTLKIPDHIEKISFLNTQNYVSESINSRYYEYPYRLKLTSQRKSGIYTYDLKEIVYTKKEKTNYFVDEISKDTIYEPTPISFIKKGNITLKEVLPITYDTIQLNPKDGLVYLYKNSFIGIYPKHIETSFEIFEQKTKSFFKIKKNGKLGWLDIVNFREYYFK